jgi:hypothetical protein
VSPVQKYGCHLTHSEACCRHAPSNPVKTNFAMFETAIRNMRNMERDVQKNINLVQLLT